MRRKKQGKELLFFAVILILVLVILYSGLRILESTVLFRDQGDGGFISKTITRDGVDYFPRQDITTVLVMGIDKYGPVEASDYYNNTGASDMNILLIFDETNKCCRVLHLNRDTMLEMPVLGLNGKKAGTYFGQLALAHTYGTGLDDSCVNTREAISDFLYGVEIDYYVAMHMDAISILNDAVGGVTVTVTEDFSAVDPSITMGEVRLLGEQAVTFVRTRKDVGDQLNLSRIQRQTEYLDGFAEAFRVKQAEETKFILDAYSKVQPYIVTDCSANAVSGMMDHFSSYEILEVVTPEGENVLSEQYFEFYVDQEKLDELILRLFYAPKK